MSSLKKVSIIVFALSVLLFSSSCDNNVTFSGSEVVIEEPSFIEGSTEGKSLVTATARVDKYMLKMVPQWGSSDYVIVGDTSKNTNAVDGYIEITPPFNNLGYFSQGLWDFSLRAYSSTEEGDVLVYEVNKTVEINSDSTTIAISSSEIIPPDSTTLCKVTLMDFDFLATGPVAEYGNENEFGMKLSYMVRDLSDSSTVCKETYIEKKGDNVSGSDNGVVGTLDSIVIGSGFSSGAYSLSIFLNEYVDGDWIHTGGTTISFVAVPGIEINISGDPNEIELYRYDYQNVGTGDSGIIIDSGVNSKVTVTAYDSNGAEIESAIKDQTVTLKAVAKTSNDEGISVSSFKWLLDGEEQNANEDGSFTFTPSSVKTYTITYIFLDDTSYNTISGNCYLTVAAST